jgi:DNA adenine methylase
MPKLVIKAPKDCRAGQAFLFRSEATIPFLKWPGGKRWFVANHAHLFPSSFNRYIEPFLGSGSVFFFLRPAKALLGDINPQIVDTYTALKNDWFEVEQHLERHDECHSESYYYLVRAARPRLLSRRAAQFIYLNRTCFNGIYRVNLEGNFNVPKGTKDLVLFDGDDFGSVSKLLRRAAIKLADFEVLIDEAKKGDFVFADPPYTVRHNVNGFIKYNENLFSWTDQIRLADSLKRARDRGSKIVATNANHSSVRKLYKDRGFFVRSVSRFSSISAAAESRKDFEELVILSDAQDNRL